MKIKILYLIDTLKLAGAQLHLREVIRQMDRQEFELHLCCLHLAQPVETLEGIPVTNLGIRRIYDLQGLRGLFKLIRLIREKRIDIVHSYLFSENILGAVACRLAGVRAMITSRRDTGMLVQGRWQHHLAYRLTNRWVDRIICVSEAVRRITIRTEAAPEEKVCVIPNGVDTARLAKSTRPAFEVRKNLGIAPDAPVIGMVANLSWIKGHKDVIAAASEVVRAFPATQFLFIGDGPLRQDLETMAAATGLAEHIRFLGRRNDIPELLSIMDISLNASYSEGMSNTILESMACGIPVVATNVDGNPETVNEGVSGLLVPAHNPTELAQALIRLLGDKAMARKMGENAKRRIEEHFTLDGMLQKMQQEYRRLLQPKVGFIFSQFPCYDETFILREMNELAAAGLEFQIYSLKTCRDAIIHDEALPLKAKTRYVSFVSPWLLLINILSALWHPLRYCLALATTIRNNLTSAEFLLKSLVLFPQAVGFAAMARRNKLTQIHGQWATYPATVAGIISRLNRIPFSFTGHAHDIYVNTTGLRQKIRAATMVLTCTAYNKTHLVRIANDPAAHNKIIVTYHGLDTHRFIPQASASAPTKLRILSVGSLLECKGFDILLRACSLLHQEGIDVTCTIAGGGRLHAQLTTLAKELGIADKVILTGYLTQEKLLPLYQQTDLFVLPVRLDIHWGIPNVLLEAMACGIPVITTGLPSIPELIQNEANGLIVPENDPRATAEAVLKLYRNQPLRATFSRSGREVISEKFDSQKNARQLAGLFKQAGNSNASPRQRTNPLRLFGRRFLSTLLYVTRPAAADGVVVLMYHRVNDTLAPDELVVSTATFRQQMEFLQHNGYEVLDLTGLQAALTKKTRAPRSRPQVVITFDDGYRDNYLNAFPILREFGFPALIFLTAGMIGTTQARPRYLYLPAPDMLNWQEVKEMAAAGIEFGAHTISHQHLSGLTLAASRKEIADSKRAIETETGLTVRSFCYPYGDYTPAIKQIVGGSGFCCAFTVRPGVNYPAADRYALHRTAVNGTDSLFDFRKKLSGAYDLLHYLLQRTKRSARPTAGDPAGTRLNVLYLIWSLGLGGAERALIELVKGLDKTRFNPVVACLNEKGQFADELEQAGIPVIALQKKPGIDLSLIKKISGLLEEHHIHIMHTHMWSANFWGRFALQRRHPPIVIATEQNVDRWKKWYHLLLDHWLAGRTDRIIAVSTQVKDFYIEKAHIPAEKIGVIYNSVDLDRYQFEPRLPEAVRSHTSIGVIGRLVPQKGHRYFLEAMQALIPDYPVKGIIVGSGPLETELNEECRKLGLNGNIEFLGLRRDIPELMRTLDIVVLPSLREGLPLVALEAMASGVPVIATAVGGTPEVVHHEQTGILIPAQNHLALKDAIIRLLSDNQLRNRLVAQARQLVQEQFSTTTMVAKIQDLYTDCFVLRPKLRTKP